MSTRTERDTLGEIEVPGDKAWGAQTERSLRNFPIGSEKMPPEVVYALVSLKKAASVVNARTNGLASEKAEVLSIVCDDVLDGKYDDHFPLVVWQTGSGTQSNMNVNEVLAYLANERLEKQESFERVHPNDDVNRAQSSNDTFPTAMHIAVYDKVQSTLLPRIRALKSTIRKKAQTYERTYKIGRTHLQDATPLTLGQEMSGWWAMLEKSGRMIEQSVEYCLELAIGGTAVGTGINAPPTFGQDVAEVLKQEFGYEFRAASNTFHALTSHDELVHVHGALKALAADLHKVANDVRYLASGPRCGYGELTIPANEPGSSIMPGKVNPTQAEALTMVCAQVFGNDVTIGFAASQGQFELNVYKPVIVYNVLQSIQLLADAMESFRVRCVEGLEANEETIAKTLNESLMLVTALNPHIGYEKAAKIAKKAFADETSLKAAAVALEFVTEEQFNEWVDPKKMVRLNPLFPTETK
ncbi:class II fumarate hydratase [Bacillus fonticola]|uniref:class II fumarate hydratase n=1 Tax=Bacillus fonticola TaxID=2728853 RepID=UPI00147430C8|nr:class II fumarate hydratase [Bacillus fonticola]